MHTYGNYAHGTVNTQEHGGQTYYFAKPSATNTMVMFREKPNLMGAIYDARYVYNAIRSKYGLTSQKANASEAFMEECRKNYIQEHGKLQSFFNRTDKIIEHCEQEYNRPEVKNAFQRKFDRKKTQPIRNTHSADYERWMERCRRDYIKKKGKLQTFFRPTTEMVEYCEKEYQRMK
ncbi:MAG: hypothetical protein HQL31_08115 [Planctomycetes bacterium]|nr:hypothetical protein [Planctomycetota bacterium]